MKRLSWILLSLGVVLVLAGFFAWQLDRRAESLKVFMLVFPTIPGWAFVIMGWTGLLADRIGKEFKREASISSIAKGS